MITMTISESKITWPFSLLAKDINRDDGNDDYVKHDDNAVQYDDDVGDLRSVLGTGWGRWVAGRESTLVWTPGCHGDGGDGDGDG